MKTPFIHGKLIYLRPLDVDDLNEKYLSWLNDPQIRRYLESGIFPYTRGDLVKYYEQIASSPNNVFLSIIDKESDQHIGNIKLGPINWVHRKGTLGILIGEKSFWGKGVGSEALHLMIEYGFFRLNLKRIDLGVYAEHKAAIRIYEKIGFQVEGCFREDLFHEGEYKDRIWMGLLRSDFISLITSKMK
jgi:[ribosomal protein S5]-alanine N-acetyltransferase